MGRPPKNGTARVGYRGITICLYLNCRNTWEASFTIPGKKRSKAYGPTQAQCQAKAEEKIRNELNSEGFAARSDEEAARRILEPFGVTLVEAARSWCAQHSKPLVNATLAQVRTVWLAHVKATKSFHDHRSLETCSSRLMKDFGDRQIASITVQELQLWQDELEKSLEGRTVRNVHDAAKRLWKYAKRRGYLDDEKLTAMERIERPKAKPGRKEIFTHEEMQKLLDAAWRKASPAAAAMVLGAFGYMRSEELCRREAPIHRRLQWEDFRWKERFIWIRPEVAKNGTSREIPLTNHLKNLLWPLRKEGPVYPDARLDLDYAEISSAAGVTWKANALRHSCLTYAMLTEPVPSVVANRGGNTVSVIESNYRNRGATADQAKKWLSLKPKVIWGSGIVDEQA